MLRLLLDEHISPTVGRELRAKLPKAFIIAVQEWENGTYIGLPDEELLLLAHEQAFTLVTYDQRTIVPLLKSWGEAGAQHGGVIFVDEKTIAPNNFGGLVKALLVVAENYGEEDWTGWVIYLTVSD